MNVRKLLAIAALAATPAFARPGETVLGTITILDGEVSLLRGSDRLVAAEEGTRVFDDDVVETGASRFARLELAPGPILDLGPATRLLLGPANDKRDGRAALYLLGGWLKISAADAAARTAVSSPHFDLDDVAGVTLVDVANDETMLFVESGSARLADRRARTPAVKLNAGDFVELRGNGAAVRGQRPAAAFLAKMPVPFRDSLPSRLATFAERKVAPADAGSFSYKDVVAWLDADRTLGHRLVQAWAAKASEPPFRSMLVANLAAHPEWFPVLYPDCCNAPAAEPRSAAGASTRAAGPAAARPPAPPRLAPPSHNP